MYQVINAARHSIWRDALSVFPRIDVCHLPEYHEAYRLRIEGAEARMWQFQSSGESFCYPFLLSPIVLTGDQGEREETGYTDISGIYGYSGPLSTTDNPQFLQEAWQAFDQWALDEKVVSEFIRFSTYVDNTGWAHPDTRVEYNRPVAIALLPDDPDAFLMQLKGKTRNMIRKAAKSGLDAREIDLRDALEDFRQLYQQTMGRNQATEFFLYDDDYYDRLTSLPAGELLSFAVYEQNNMVAAAIGLVHGDMAFYHLGASTQAASRLGAGNLVLFSLASALIRRGIGFFSVGGGRTTDSEDALYRFKKSNATSAGEFHIGKRVLQQDVHDSIAATWEAMNHQRSATGNLQFYR